MEDREIRSYTPRHLAERILRTRSALEGERKQVTVLFADVKESMHLAEQIDPERWHLIMNRFFAILSDGVHRFEGTINQFTGDGIMALFGAPIAHEDHAQRACHAALYLTEELRRYSQDLRREHGFDFSVRMGMNSGEVVVGKIGDDLRMDYTAQGHTVGLAARMEQIAEAGSVYLAEATAKLVAGFFELEDLGAFRLKGVHEALRVHALRGVGRLRTRLDAARARGFARFVGRDAEMEALEAALHSAVSGRGGVVGVAGVPGVGKSRLCHEFVQRCEARGVRVFDAHCPPHARNLPLLPVRDLLRSFVGVRPDDEPQVAREKAAGCLLLLDRGFEQGLGLVFEFLGVPDGGMRPHGLDPATAEHALLELFVSALVQRAAREPAVFFVDDVHWADNATNEFLARLAAAIMRTRALLLLNFRPDYSEHTIARSSYVRLPLQALASDAVDALLHELLGDHPSVAQVAGLIRDRAQGNPFFVEEAVRSLFDRGRLVRGEPGAAAQEAMPLLARVAEDVEIPATVQALIAARIDRLPEESKEVIQLAAVIGREFSQAVLSGVVDEVSGKRPSAAALIETLSELQRLEFIDPDPAGDYTFRHSLLRDVAYGAQLSDRRVRAHAAVARALEKVHEEHVGLLASLIAHHWELAGKRTLAWRWRRRAALRVTHIQVKRPESREKC
jgi:class 3 adenylate cyclase